MPGVGSQLFQPPVTLINTMNGLTQKYFAPTLVDSIFQPSPTFWRATRNGRNIDGAGAIVWTVISTEETTGGAYYGTQVLNTALVDSAQPAELEWKFYYQSIVIPTTDIDMNAGPSQVVSLVKAKEEIAMGSLLQKLSRAIYGVAPQNTAIDVDNLPTALTSSGTYANITISSAFWLSAGLNGTRGGGTLSLTEMQLDYGRCTFGNEEPDTVLGTQTGYNNFVNLLTPNQRYFDEETTRAGFKNHLMFNSAVVLHDQFVPALQQYMITSKYFNPVFMSNNHFRIRPFTMPTNQEIIASRVTVGWNLKLDTLRQHSMHTAMTNA